MQGKVIFFNTKSKFGFIKGDDEAEYFVRESNLLEAVEKDDAVEFETRPAKRGPEAIRVKKLSAGT